MFSLLGVLSRLTENGRLTCIACLLHWVKLLQYVAVCGLPQKRQNHQIVMARFANDCLQALAPLLRKLERELGTSLKDIVLPMTVQSGATISCNGLSYV
jgi:hypothetical protein